MLNATELEGLGFFRHVKSAELPRVRAALEAHGLIGLVLGDADDATHRFYHVDAEELAEGDFLNVLGWLAPFLRHEGVPIEATYGEVKFPAIRQGPWGPARPVHVGTIQVDADGWLAVVGTRVSSDLTPVERLRIGTRPGGPLEEVTQDKGEELEDPYVVHVGSRTIAVVDQHTDVWMDPPQRMLRFLNELLTAHGSSERAYGHAAGNDFAIVFATPEMAQLVNDASPPGLRLHDGSFAG